MPKIFNEMDPGRERGQEVQENFEKEQNQYFSIRQ